MCKNPLSTLSNHRPRGRGKKTRKLLVTAKGLGSIRLKSMAQDGECRGIELCLGSPSVVLESSVAKRDRRPHSGARLEIYT